MVLTLGQVIRAVPEIAMFPPSINALRPQNPIFEIEGYQYEFRLFCFTLLRPDTSHVFRDWVINNKLEEEPLKHYESIKLIKLLAYSVNTDDTYINLSLRALPN